MQTLKPKYGWKTGRLDRARRVIASTGDGSSVPVAGPGKRHPAAVYAWPAPGCQVDIAASKSSSLSGATGSGAWPGWQRRPCNSTAT